MKVEHPLIRFWREFRENHVAVAAMAMVSVLAGLAILAPLVSPQDPYNLTGVVYADAHKPPGFTNANGFTYLLGTDGQGKDLLSGIIYGLRISIEIALAAGCIAFLVGASLGSIAAYIGGRTEALLMRIVDLQLSFPAILLALVISAMLGKGKGQLIAALVAAQYAYFARTAHGAASAERGKDYVDAALSTPLPAGRVVFRHILPNSLPPLIVVATAQIANAIALEATLSFLGLGLPPTEPSLGSLIAIGQQYMLAGRYWVAFYPGIALIVLIVSINLVGDQVRDQLNPRLKR